MGAAEALGGGWEEVGEMEEKLAEELGISVEELEDYLDKEGLEEQVAAIDLPDLTDVSFLNDVLEK